MATNSQAWSRREASDRNAFDGTYGVGHGNVFGGDERQAKLVVESMNASRTRVYRTLMARYDRL